MDRGAWWAAVHWVARSRTWLSDFTIFSLSCTGEGNGNLLQCSCLENPRDGGAWWAAIYGVAQNRTRLKRLSSSSKSVNLTKYILSGQMLGYLQIYYFCSWNTWLRGQALLVQAPYCSPRGGRGLWTWIHSPMLHLQIEGRFQKSTTTSSSSFLILKILIGWSSCYED